MALRTWFLCAVINVFGAKELLFSEISFAIPLANRLKLGITEKGMNFFCPCPLIIKQSGEYSVSLSKIIYRNGIFIFYANSMLICFPNPLHIRNKVLSIISDFPFSIREI